MSIRAVDWVFQSFKADERGNRMSGQMLVMLAVADSAEDDGTMAFPGEMRLAEKTRMSTRQVRRVLGRLVEEGHLIREERKHRRHNHRYDIAGMRPPDILSGIDHRTTTTEYRTSPTRTPDISPLDGNTTRPKRRPIETSYSLSEAYRLCSLLADLIQSNGSKRPIVTQAWIAEAERMLRIDERDLIEAGDVIRFSQSDPFWMTNILSMPKLRQKYDQLRLKMMNPNGRARVKDRAAEIMEQALAKSRST